VTADDADAVPGEGCVQCRGHYTAWSEVAPVVLGTSAGGMTTILRCPACGAFWEDTVGGYPHRISVDRAVQELSAD
jgi:hypothetical protein